MGLGQICHAYSCMYFWRFFDLFGLIVTPWGLFDFVVLFSFFCFCSLCWGNKYSLLCTVLFSRKMNIVFFLLGKMKTPKMVFPCSFFFLSDFTSYFLSYLFLPITSSFNFLGFADLWWAPFPPSQQLPTLADNQLLGSWPRFWVGNPRFGVNKTFWFRDGWSEEHHFSGLAFPRKSSSALLCQRKLSLIFGFFSLFDPGFAA